VYERLESVQVIAPEDPHDTSCADLAWPSIGDGRGGDAQGALAGRLNNRGRLVLEGLGKFVFEQWVHVLLRIGVRRDCRPGALNSGSTRATVRSKSSQHNAHVEHFLRP
jgi:hypothetical protein